MSFENDTDYADILSKCSINGQPEKRMRGYIDGTITGYDELPDNPTPEEVLIFREKPALRARKRQITINLLGLGGGRQYVNARLSRYSGENEIDWIGGKRPDGSCSTGRLQQTHSFPYLGRIAGKINQYCFQTTPTREDADEDVVKDITRDGKSVNDLMREVSATLLASKWCWIGIDAPARKVDGTQYNQAEKEALKIRPYWQLYSALDVMDWHFDERGNLVWLKSKRIKYDDSAPSSNPTPKKVISLWEIGRVTEFTIVETHDRRFSTNKRVQVDVEEIQLTKSNGQPLDVIPFVLCGEADAQPQPFDDLESINRTIMDLGSVDRANYFNAVYPQLVIPASVMARGQQDGYAKTISEVARLIIGFKYPITIDKDDAAPSYLMPDSAAIGSIATRIDGLKSDLFEVVGLALEKNSRQVASAEAKAWDNLDVSAVIAARAEQLEDIETKAVGVSKAWDESFQEWIPKYNRDFDVGDFESEMNALIAAGNGNHAPTVTKLIEQKIVDRLDRIGSQLTAEEMEAVLADIEKWNPNSFADDLALPAP